MEKQYPDYVVRLSRSWDVHPETVLQHFPKDIPASGPRHDTPETKGEEKPGIKLRLIHSRPRLIPVIPRPGAGDPVAAMAQRPHRIVGAAATSATLIACRICRKMSEAANEEFCHNCGSSLLQDATRLEVRAHARRNADAGMQPRSETACAAVPAIFPQVCHERAEPTDVFGEGCATQPQCPRSDQYVTHSVIRSKKLGPVRNLEEEEAGTSSSSDSTPSTSDSTPSTSDSTPSTSDSTPSSSDSTPSTSDSTPSTSDCEQRTVVGIEAFGREDRSSGLDDRRSTSTAGQGAVDQAQGPDGRITTPTLPEDADSSARGATTNTCLNYASRLLSASNRRDAGHRRATCWLLLMPNEILAAIMQALKRTERGMSDVMRLASTCWRLRSIAFDSKCRICTAYRFEGANMAAANITYSWNDRPPRIERLALIRCIFSHDQISNHLDLFSSTAPNLQHLEMKTPFNRSRTRYLLQIPFLSCTAIPFPKLRSLDLRNAPGVGDAVLSHLISTATSLEEVTLSHVAVLSADVISQLFIQHGASLTSVKMNAVAFKDSGGAIDGLAGAIATHGTRLKHFQFSLNSLCFEAVHWQRVLSAFECLESLCLSNSNVTDGDLALLTTGCLRSLTSLDIMSCWINDLQVFNDFLGRCKTDVTVYFVATPAMHLFVSDHNALWWLLEGSEPNLEDPNAHRLLRVTEE